MVFDPECPAGRGIVAPCLNEIHAFEELIEEAEALWAAERNQRDRAGVSANWGCVGALFSQTFTDSVRSGWNDHFRAEATPIEPVDNWGNLNVAWPRRCSDNTKVDLDVILATATLPDPSPPSTEEIARAWVEQTQKEQRYFIENVRYGIRTSSDQSIWNHLLEMSPSWLDSDLRHEMNGYVVSDE